MFSRKKVVYRAEDPALFFAPRTVVGCLLAWLFPGAGHWYLGKKRKAVLLGASLLICFCLGIVQRGDFFPFSGEGVFRAIGAFCELGFGSIYLLARLLVDRGSPLSLTYDYGTTYLLIAGMINWLAVVDAFDTAVGRK